MNGRAAATGFLVAALGLQTVAGFKLLAPPLRFTALAPLRVAPSPTLWPFLDYDMYSRSMEAGSYADRWMLVALHSDQSERLLSPGDFGSTWREFRDEILWPVRDGHEGAASRVATRLEQRGGARPVAFRIERERLVIAEDGLQVLPRAAVRWALVFAESTP